jgi:hypothetical protein
MRSWIQVLETASCRNAWEGCVHQTQSGRTLLGTLHKWEGATCTMLPLFIVKPKVLGATFMHWHHFHQKTVVHGHILLVCCFRKNIRYIHLNNFTCYHGPRSGNKSSLIRARYLLPYLLGSPISFLLVKLVSLLLVD